MCFSHIMPLFLFYLWRSLFCPLALAVPVFTTGCPWFAPSYANWSMAVLLSFLTILVSAKSLPRGASKNRGEIQKQTKNHSTFYQA